MSVPVCEKVKHLGIQLTSTLSWTPHVDSLLHRVTHKVFILRRLAPVPAKKKKKEPAAQLAAQRAASAWLRTFAPTGNRKSTWLTGVALRFAQFVSF